MVIDPTSVDTDRGKHVGPCAHLSLGVPLLRVKGQSDVEGHGKRHAMVSMSVFVVTCIYQLSGDQSNEQFPQQSILFGMYVCKYVCM